MPDTHELITRYVAVWGEPDPRRRRAAIQDLWAEGGRHLLHPPEEVRAAAAGLGFATSELAARGREAIELRVARSHDEFVADGKYIFRAVGDAARLEDVVKFRWEMESVADGEVVGGGLEILLLDADDRIVADYQFPD
ncbi:hypothetical protein [Kribbella endophytica]